jgi:hypothetical protein
MRFSPAAACAFASALSIPSVTNVKTGSAPSGGACVTSHVDCHGAHVAAFGCRAALVDARAPAATAAAAARTVRIGRRALLQGSNVGFGPRDAAGRARLPRGGNRRYGSMFWFSRKTFVGS